MDWINITTVGSAYEVQVSEDGKHYRHRLIVPSMQPHRRDPLGLDDDFESPVVPWVTGQPPKD